MADNSSIITVEKVGMLGVGSMGTMMSLLLAERGYEVHFFDPNPGYIDRRQSQGGDIPIPLDDRVCREPSYEDVCKNIKVADQPKLVMLSTPHDIAVDAYVDAILPHLQKGDIVIDCGNEHWTNTERRQKDLDSRGIHYIGCGVSPGYQSARNDPSMSPGGSPEALEKVMPFLKTLAAKDNEGRPCVAPVGPGGSGHYVNMVHNGIEQGMVSVIGEVWLMLTNGLRLRYEEVADVFKSWNKSGNLRNCFPMAMGGVDSEGAKDNDGEQVLPPMRDRAVQGVDGVEEDTATWTCDEAIALHVPAATISSGHLFRCASADLDRRIKHKALGVGTKSQPITTMSRQNFVEHLHVTIYFCFLVCFAQGLDILRQKDKKEDWNLDYTQILQLWRGGCIIQADRIIDLLERLYKQPDHDPDDILSNPEVVKELSTGYPAIKKIVLKAVESDAFIPAISQSLEYYKYETSTDLPTQFMEAQLDRFGQNMFSRRRASVDKALKRMLQHFEWKPAYGSPDQRVTG